MEVPRGHLPANSCVCRGSFLPWIVPGTGQGGTLPQAGGPTANQLASSTPLQQNVSSAGKELSSGVGRVTTKQGSKAVSGTEDRKGWLPGGAQPGFSALVSHVRVGFCCE